MLKPLVVLLLLTLAGCQTAYYSAMEKVGVHKRDILVDRVEDARDAQQEAQQQFKSALEELTSLINFDGGDIQQAYDTISDQYNASRATADELSARINKIESVADALFDEWQDEIEQFSNPKLGRLSRQQLSQTQRAYGKLLSSMQRSEKKMQPVLTSLKDNMLYMKHNLNARAIRAISVEFASLKKEIELLVRDVNQSIEESNQFIAEMSEQTATQ